MSTAATVSNGVYHLLEADGHDPAALEPPDGSLIAAGNADIVGSGGGVGFGGGGGVSGDETADIGKLTKLLLEYLTTGVDPTDPDGGAPGGGGAAGARGATTMNLSLDGLNGTGPFADVVGPRPLSAKAAVALTLGVLGLLANLSSLVAISRIRSSLTANLRLIVSLCASDMLVSASILLKVYHEGALSSRLGDVADTCVERVLQAVRMTAHIISLLNLVGLALDHYCAILKPLNYPTIMCRKHANLMVVFFWLASALCGFSDFLVPSAYFSFCSTEGGGAGPGHYCMAVWCSVYTEEYLMFAMALLSSILMTALYTTIFVQIRRYQSFQQQYRQNVKRNRRGLVTTFVIVATFMVTWLPYCLFEVILILSARSKPARHLELMRLARALELHFFNLLLLNSILDPVIYAIRMREVQNGYRNMLPCRRKRGRELSRMSQSTERRGFNMSTSTAAYTKQCQSETYL